MTLLIDCDVENDDVMECIIMDGTAVASHTKGFKVLKRSFGLVCVVGLGSGWVDG